MKQNKKTIKECVELYHTNTKVCEAGNALCVKMLSTEEKFQNKTEAFEMLKQFSKEELIEFILHGDENWLDDFTTTSAVI